MLRLMPAVTALALAGLLAGCGGEDSEKQRNSANRTGDRNGATTSSSASGTLEVAGRTITFDTDVCMSSDGETLVSGPGKDSDGTPVYVDLDATSSTHGGISVELGTDKKFSSGDESLQANDSSGDFTVEADGGDVRVKAEFTGDDGTPIGAGVMAVSCL